MRQWIVTLTFAGLICAIPPFAPAIAQAPVEDTGFTATTPPPDPDLANPDCPFTQDLTSSCSPYKIDNQPVN